MNRYSRILHKHLGDAFRDLTSLSGLCFQGLFIAVLAFYDFRTGLMYAAGFISIEIVAYAIKILFPTARPDKQGYSNFLEKMDAGSFPSIHSARAMLMGATLITIWDHIILKLISVVLIILIGASRVYLKRHYLRDVIGGYILGVLLWLLFSQALL